MCSVQKIPVEQPGSDWKRAGPSWGVFSLSALFLFVETAVVWYRDNNEEILLDFHWYYLEHLKFVYHFHLGEHYENITLVLRAVFSVGGHYPPFYRFQSELF